MSAAVRRLGPGDAAGLAAVSALFADAFEDADTYLSAPPDEAYRERLLADGKFVALAAIDGGRTVGGLVGYELVKFEQARSEFYIYDLAVAADRRREGIATALIEVFRGVARAASGSVVYVQADYGDEPAVALYTKLGRREDVMHFDIEV